MPQHPDAALALKINNTLTRLRRTNSPTVIEELTNLLLDTSVVAPPKGAHPATRRLYRLGIEARKQLRNAQTY